jgi:class 3 adenylate cyclase/tetratricopeptide (TPR) repeat protein
MAEMVEAAQEQASLTEPTSVVRTFLIADVRGYTRFTQEHGDEAAAQLASKFASILREEVSARGGQLVELRGDEALAAFGSARQALRTAIALQARFSEETQQQPELPLRVGIGLDAGEAVPVETGYRGGALNLAARLSSLAGPNEVLASEGVIHLARRIAGIVYVERGSMPLKGFDHPVRVVQVLTESNGSPTPNGIDAAHSMGEDTQWCELPLPIGGFLGALPEGLLVGRDEEFGRLLEAINAVTTGSGRFILLVGEPGIGKTRVAQEVTLKARNQGFLVATGRCYEPEASVPFYPFLEVLATLYEQCPSDLRARVPHRWPDIQRLLPNQAPAQWPVLSNGKEEHQRLFWAVSGFLQTIATIRPVAVLIDDLHWADASSLELLQHIARHTRVDRILLVGTYRDVEIHRQHPLEATLLTLNRERLVEEMPIRRLDFHDTTALIGAILGDAEPPLELVQLLYRQTEGNPFFIEEVVRSLVERGDVYRKGDRWEWRAVEEIEVPKSIRAVIGQRLSRLSEGTQTVLREASVLGLAFTFKDLQGISNRSEDEVEGALEEAIVAGLVHETEREAYAFNHGLTQATLYAELPSRRKRRLHRAAGEALSRLPERVRDRRAGELAWHFLEGDDPAQALPYTILAGDRARDVFAFSEAENHYRVALDLAHELGDVTSEAMVLERLAAVLRTIARYDEALQLLNDAVQLHRAAGNVKGERQATAHIGRVHALRGTPEDGIRRIRALLDQIEAATDINGDTRGESPTAQPGVASLYAALANLYEEGERFSDQLVAAERALELARAVGDERILAESEMWRAAALAELGDPDDARQMLEDVIPLAESTGDLLTLSRAFNLLAWVYSEAGQYDRERQYRERALETAERLGDPTRLEYMIQRLGWFHFMTGNWREARALFERAIAIWRSISPVEQNATGPSWMFTCSAVVLDYLRIIQGDEVEESRYLREQLATVQNWHEYFHLPWGRWALLWGQWMLADLDLQRRRAAEALARLEVFLHHAGIDEWSIMLLQPVFAWAHLEASQDPGRIPHAERLVSEVINYAQQERNRTLLAEALRVRGTILTEANRPNEARYAFDEALSIARTIHQPYQEARVLYHYGLLQAHLGEIEAARDRLGEALAILHHLKAKLNIEQTEAVLKRIGGQIARAIPTQYALIDPA